MDCSACTAHHSFRGDQHGQIVEPLGSRSRIVFVELGIARLFFGPLVGPGPLMVRAEALPRAAFALAIAAALVACQRALPTAEALDARALPTRTEAPAKAPETAEPRTATAKISPYDPLNDVVLTGRIKAALLADPQLAGSDISVNTDHGVVALTGTVKSQEQVAIASAHAQHEDGVMRIDNHLTTNPE